jgi:hypothetical protein
MAVELVHGAAESLGSRWQKGPKVFRRTKGLQSGRKARTRHDQRSTETPKIAYKLLQISRALKENDK